MSQSINIIKIIEENPSTKLSKPYEGKLINKLKDNFSTTEQQLFISSFYCYLNYKSNDFVIDLDDIWGWLGFARKTNAKNVLEKYFKVETDYKIVLPQARENLSNGRPSEKIMLNIKTFKKMCLKANTPKANEIHEYYIKLEETLHEIIDEESNELRLQLVEKDNEMQIIKEEKEKLEKRYIKRPKLAKDKKNVVYLMTTNDSEKRREYTVGKALDLSNRKENYDQNKLHDFKIIYYVSCKSSKFMDMIEAIVLAKLGRYRCKAGRDVFFLPEMNDIKLFTDVFDNCEKIYDDVEHDHIVYAKRSENWDKDKRMEYSKKYNEEHKDEIRERGREYRELNSEFINEIIRDKHAENPEINAEKCKKYYEEHKEEVIAQVLGHYYENREVILEERKDFYQNNKEVILEERKEYYEDNYATKIAPHREVLELCECGMTITHYGLKKHKTTDLHKRLFEKKANVKDGDLPTVIKCECGMTISKLNLLRHKKSDRHTRLMKKKHDRELTEEKTTIIF